MSQERTCPNCQATVPADAPEGFCPACALRAGFDSTHLADGVPVDGAAAAPTLTAPGTGAEPPSIEELVRALPELENFELLGQGGMGAVFRARHRHLDRPVAVKVLGSALRDDEAFAERFTREARTLAQLDHPNVVKVYDFGHRQGLYYLVMELVDGVNLRQTLRAGGLSTQEALAMVPRICEALQFAHDHGVVHRDIKPENILIDRQGAVKIADFGLAKLVGAGADRNLTQTRQIMGTPNYMAPEQVEHPTEVDHRADIFALGVVFYELLTGELPIGRFPPPSRKVEIDVRLDDVVLRTLEKEPNLRYQQARELASDVEELSSAPSRRRRRRRREPEDRSYEYRSEKTVFGIPLIHVAFSRDREGKRMKVANGIIAVGDVAIGGVAIGGFSFGGITFGGVSVGLLSLGGVALGLLIALGGFAVGGYATAGMAIGLMAQGFQEVALFTPEEGTYTWVPILAWLVATLGLTGGAAAAIYAWQQSISGQRSD